MKLNQRHWFRLLQLQVTLTLHEDSLDKDQWAELRELVDEGMKASLEEEKEDEVPF